MTCEACRAAFAHEPKDERAAAVHAAMAETCGCENFISADGSPGPVADTEVLHCLVSDPQHLLPSGDAHPALLAGQIDKGGLSVLREGASIEEFFLTLRELQESARANGRERFLHGIFSFETGAVRQHGGQRFMCVYDTAQDHKPHHADIMAPVIDAPSRRQKEKGERARIAVLIERFGPVISPSAFREGAFHNFARQPSAE